MTANAPASADRDFCEDIRASARSAPANVAEGFGRYGHREFARFLGIARASLIETQNHLADAHDCGYITAVERDRLLALAERALRATTRLHSTLTRSEPRRHG